MNIYGRLFTGGSSISTFDRRSLLTKGSGMATYCNELIRHLSRFALWTGEDIQRGELGMIVQECLQDAGFPLAVVTCVVIPFIAPWSLLFREIVADFQRMESELAAKAAGAREAGKVRSVG